MIVLDTHTWIWWLNGATDKLTDRWMNSIRNASHVAISAISCFEVAWLNHHNRIELPVELSQWFEKSTTGSGVEILPLTPEIAEVAVTLPEHHSDPQDRLIMATAIAHRCKLISADSKFDLYNEFVGLRIPR